MDKSSEEWRHICEANTLLGMPLLKRKAHLVAVEARRGADERKRLEATMRAMWITKTANAVMAMARDDQKVAKLLSVQETIGPYMRSEVENEIERLTAEKGNG